MTTRPSGRAAEELLAVAHQLADAARAPALAQYRNPELAVDNKQESGFDPVTVADRGSELAIRERLAALRPMDGIIGEEFVESPGSSGVTWVIDPIDGTRSFIIGMPVWTVIIGAHDGSRPIVGIIDQPYLDERYWGVSSAEGNRAGLAGRFERPIHTRRCGAISEARISTTHVGAFATPEDYTAYRTVERECRLTRAGGDAYQYALLANGGLDLVIESGLQCYDILGVIPVIEGAGGIVTDWEGGDCAWGGRVLAAGDRDLHRLVRSRLDSA